MANIVLPSNEQIFHMLSSVGHGEILEKMKFCNWNFASYVLRRKIDFKKNIKQNNFFDSRLFCLSLAKNKKNFQNL